VRIHLAGEHPRELEVLELLRDTLYLADDVSKRALVLLFGRELVQPRGLVESLVDAAERVDDGLERRALAP
jgi:hypothetical protein